MLSWKQIALPLALATPLVSPSAQGGAPPSRPSSPPVVCLTLTLVDVPDSTHLFARMFADGHMTEGCLGPAGTCKVPVWVYC